MKEAKQSKIIKVLLASLNTIAKVPILRRIFSYSAGVGLGYGLSDGKKHDLKGFRREAAKSFIKSIPGYFRSKIMLPFKNKEVNVAEISKIKQEYSNIKESIKDIKVSYLTQEHRDALDKITKRVENNYLMINANKNITTILDNMKNDHIQIRKISDLAKKEDLKRVSLDEKIKQINEHSKIKGLNKDIDRNEPCR